LDSNKDYRNITFKLNDYTNLWELNQLTEVIKHNRNYEPIVTIPNLLDAQADRRFNDDESTGLKLVCEFLKGLPVKRYNIFHPHNGEVVEAVLGDKVKIIDNREFMMEILVNHFDYGIIPDALEKTPKYKNLILMSSDAGGFKPLGKLCDSIGWKGEMYSASKFRSWDEEDGTKFVQQIDRNDFQGKDILIVDDICVYGGTFKGLSTLLKDKNVGNLYLAASHMTVPNLGRDNVCKYFKTVFTTNSKYEEYRASYETRVGSNEYHDYQPENLKLIKLFDYEKI